MGLASLRKAVALTQLELAQACKVSKQTIGSWERGVATPRPGHIRKLAQVLQTTIKAVQEAIDTQQGKKQEENHE
jgi:transcriptional regulator with XRE-family HTH domain